MRRQPSRRRDLCGQPARGGPSPLSSADEPVGFRVRLVPAGPGGTRRSGEGRTPYPHSDHRTGIRRDGHHRGDPLSGGRFHLHLVPGHRQVPDRLDDSPLTTVDGGRIGERGETGTIPNSPIAQTVGSGQARCGGTGSGFRLPGTARQRRRRPGSPPPGGHFRYPKVLCGFCSFPRERRGGQLTRSTAAPLTRSAARSVSARSAPSSGYGTVLTSR